MIHKEADMRSLWIAFFAALVALPLFAVAAPTTDSGSESLGNQLLDDLAPTSKPVADPAAATTQPNNAPLAPRSSPVAPNSAPLARVHQGMHNAQSLLAQ